MREQLSIQQIFRIIWELEPTIVRYFVAALRSSALDSAFENFDRDQESIETERFFLRWDIALSVAKEVIAKRGLSGSKLDETLRRSEMSGRKRRIEKLESELKSSDLISLWLGHLEQFESPTEYLESELGDGETGSIEYQFIQQASARRKIARDGAAGKSVDAEVFRSLKRLLFFKTLVWAANSECENIVANCRNRLDPARQIAEILDFLRGSDAWARPYRPNPPSTVLRPKENFASVPAAEYKDAPACCEKFFVAKVNGMISDVLGDLRAAELAVGSISERFFHGRTIIFQSIARAMNDVRHDAESGTREAKTEPDNGACSEGLESAAQDKSQVVVAKLVDYAKAVALLRFGERAQAAKMLRPHLEGGSG